MQIMTDDILESETKKTLQTQYDVYIYHRPANTNEKIHDWERKSSTCDARRALLKAKRLHKSDKYQKVEVKKRRFDSKKNCMRSTTLRIYDAATKDNKIIWALVGVTAILSTITAFLVYLA